MKNILFICFLISTLLPNWVYAKTINIGVIEYPPHINVKGKAGTGKAVDYVKEVLCSVNLEVKITAYPPRRAMAEFKSGRLDLLLPIDGNLSDIKKLTKPFFHATPGLCFTKEKFVSILSATHRFKGLKVGYGAGAAVVPDLLQSEAKMVPIQGKSPMKRGVEMLMKNRFDAIYHPNPVNVYNLDSPNYDKIACSYFYGHSADVFIAASTKLDGQVYKTIDEAFTKALKKKSYEYYFTQGK